jgi:hypothetical protein
VRNIPGCNRVLICPSMTPEQIWTNYTPL